MITNDLGKLLEGFSYDALPQDIVLAAKTHLLDYFAIGIAGYELNRTGPILDIYSTPGNCTVLGYGSKLDTRSAAVVNGFMAHSTWYDDGSRISGGHPSTAIFPALLALAEQRKSSGKDIILSTVVGYEIFNRTGIVMYPATVRHGFLPTGLLSPIAASVACGKLIGLPEGGIARAISIATPLGTGLKSAFKGGDAQPIQIGRGSEAGLVSALMAEQGIKGYAGNLDAFLTAHDTNEGMSICSDSSMNYQIKNTYIKIHAGCRGNHAPLDVVFSIVKEHDVNVSEIDHVEIEVDTITAANEIHNPKNRDDAQFNIPFCVAIALIRGNALLPTFSDANVNDPEIKAFMDKVKIIVNPELDKLLPNKRGAIGRFYMNDGNVFNAFTDIPEGEPERPLSHERVIEKFCALSEPTLGKEKVAAVVDYVNRLDSLENIDELMANLHI